MRVRARTHIRAGPRLGAVARLRAGARLRIRDRWWLIGLLAGGISVGGCAVNPPFIIETFWQINYRIGQTSPEPTEELVLFLHLSDEDGDDDIEAIELIHDGGELYWSLNPSTWERSEIDGELWYGSTAVRMYRDRRFPRGAYRIRVIDRAGESASSSLYSSSDRFEPEPELFPTLLAESHKVTIESIHDQRQLWFYDGGGGVVKVVATSSDVIGLTPLLSPSERTRTVAAVAYAYDGERGVGFISRTVEVPD